MPNHVSPSLLSFFSRETQISCELPLASSLLIQHDRSSWREFTWPAGCFPGSSRCFLSLPRQLVGSGFPGRRWRSRRSGTGTHSPAYGEQQIRRSRRGRRTCTVPMTTGSHEHWVHRACDARTSVRVQPIIARNWLSTWLLPCVLSKQCLMPNIIGRFRAVEARCVAHRALTVWHVGNKLTNSPGLILR